MNRGFLLIISMLVFVAGCRNMRTADSGELVVYGRPACHFCEEFRSKLDSDNVPYTFRDIDEPEYKAMMWKAIDERKPGFNDITLPVVVYKESLLVCPEYDEFLEVYSAR